MFDCLLHCHLRGKQGWLWDCEIRNAAKEAKALCLQTAGRLLHVILFEIICTEWIALLITFAMLAYVWNKE